MSNDKQKIVDLEKELKDCKKALKKANTAIYKLGLPDQGATIVELTSRIEDLLEANNQDNDRRREAELKYEQQSKFNGFQQSGLFQGYLRMEKELKELKEK